MNRFHCFVALCAFVLLTLAAPAQEVIRLYNGPAPGTEDWDHEEKEYFSPIFNTEVVTNVVNPTLTAFLPGPDTANGAAVVIAPGGGFHALSINSEGNDVAKWLNERGVAGFVLRYRLVPTGEDGVRELMEKAREPERVQKDMADATPFAGADALAAVRHVRENAAKYNVDPQKIGFMGFSAGGAVTAYVAFNYDAETRPNFVAPVYLGLGISENATPPKDAPPAFIVAATDDPLGLAADSVKFYTKWLEAEKPVEMHLYSRGGHGFGMRKQNLPSDTWIERFGDWLGVHGFLEKKAG